MLALVLLVAGVVYAVSRDRGSDSSDDATKPAVPVASPACGYKIAFLGLSSGQGSEDGVMMRDATRLAIEEFNKKDPACQVEMVEYDTQNKDEVTQESATKIVEDSKILGVVGPVYRKEILAAAPILEAAGIPMITPFAPDDDLSARGWKVFHRVVASDKAQAAAGARYLKTIMRVAKTYIVADDTDYGTVGKDQVSASLGSDVIGTVEIKRADKDFAGAVKQVLDANPDGVYYAGQYDDGAIFIKQLRTAKPGIPIVASDRIFTQSFADSHGDVADDVVITCPCIPADQADRNFASTFKARFSRNATYYGPEAYDAANIYLSGLRAGKGSRDNMLEYVNAYNGPGVARSIKFTSGGDLDVKSLQIWAYKVSGKYVERDQVIANE